MMLNCQPSMQCPVVCIVVPVGCNRWFEEAEKRCMLSNCCHSVVECLVPEIDARPERP